SNTSSVFDYTNDDSDNVNMLSIYPNPAESFINLELSSDINVYDVSIIDLMGKEVYNSNSLSSTRIDISSLEVGNYIIVVNTDSGKQLGKFVKTK
ncbi:MAG: T9SS type A sorting domain-containing protein, partial [Flavobacteriales bacterium]